MLQIADWAFRKSQRLYSSLLIYDSSEKIAREVQSTMSISCEDELEQNIEGQTSDDQSRKAVLKARLKIKVDA